MGDRPKPSRARAFAVAALLAATPAVACADGWRTAEDPGQLAFTPAFEGQEIPGVFRRFDVRLDGDPAVDGEVALTVRVDIASVAFDDDDVQAEVSGPDWFDTARHPVATFESERVKPAGDGAWRAEGRLTIKGVAHPLTLPFRFEARDGRARLAGSVVLDRRDFDIGAGAWATDDSIGYVVPVRFEARLRREDAR